MFVVELLFIETNVVKQFYTNGNTITKIASNIYLF